jgi:hypothetical protein
VISGTIGAVLLSAIGDVMNGVNKVILVGTLGRDLEVEQIKALEKNHILCTKIG